MAKSVLFVCVANSCRSQMAEAIAKKLDSSKQFQFDSAGGFPSGHIDSGAKEYLQNKGYDLSGQRSKDFTEVLPLDEYNAVVTLCEEACVALPDMKDRSRVHEWNLKDPTGFAGADRESAYGKTYDILIQKVGDLLNELSS